MVVEFSEQAERVPKSERVTASIRRVRGALKIMLTVEYQTPIRGIVESEGM